MTKRKRPPRPRRLSWWLLIHQIPPEPLYLRAKIRQRLTQVGAVALKKSVYALPHREECLEDFQWIAQEAIAGGGEAHICEAEFLESRTESTLVDDFRAARSADYEALAESLRERQRPAETDSRAVLSRARKRFEEISKIDFFSAPSRRKAELALEKLESRVEMRADPRGRSPAARPSGSTWVTRRGIHIDRIASAWLIRRFLDPRARFRFIDPKEPRRPDEVRFDMVGGDFSHEGDRCTFETLMVRNRLQDQALSQIAEIVHDIDLKDGKFERSEAPGVERLVTGLILAYPEDASRLERGLLLFDDLYQAFRKKAPALSKEVPK